MRLKILRAGAVLAIAFATFTPSTSAAPAAGQPEAVIDR